MSGLYQRLIVPVNGSAGDERVLRVVGELVHRHPATLVLIYVVEVLQSMPLDAELPEEIEKGERILFQAESLARSLLGGKADRISTDLLQARSAGAAIVDEAIERRAEAIAMATTSRVKYGKVTIGDTVPYVLKNAPCDVIVVRLGQE